MYRGVRFIESPNAYRSGTGAATLFRTIVAGAQALAWADPGLLQTFVAGFTATESYPLAQRAAAGWKGWAGGVLVDLSRSFRHVVIESTSTLSTQLPAAAPLDVEPTVARAPRASRWPTPPAVSRSEARSTRHAFLESLRAMVRHAKDDDSDAREAADTRSDHAAVDQRVMSAGQCRRYREGP